MYGDQTREGADATCLVEIETRAVHVRRTPVSSIGKSQVGIKLEFGVIPMYLENEYHLPFYFAH